MSDSIEKDAEIAAHGHMANCHAHDRRPDGTCYCGFDAALSRLVALAREAEGLRAKLGEASTMAATFNSLAGDAPAVEPEEEPFLSIWRVIRERDEARMACFDAARSAQEHLAERDAAIRAKEEFSAHAVRAATERNEALRAKEAAEARVEALTKALRRFEWEDGGGVPMASMSGMCSACGRKRASGHAEGCWLAVVLKGGTAEVKGG